MQKFINNVVGGRYFVLEQVGKGGFSNVFKVRDVKTDKIFALKQYITSDPANRKNLLEGMERELNVLKYVSHPVLPKIYNLIKEEEKFFLVMEYVEGINLKKYVETKGVLKKKQLVSVMEQVCSGLYYLHSLDTPIVYRDLKPSNIILMEDGSVKLIDFGIAKRYSREIDADEMALGSKGFAAPEQFGDKQGKGLYNTDIRSDVYGMGTTMFYLKTGKVYKKNSRWFRVSHKLKKIIVKCTKSNPNDRFQNCIEVLCAIKNLHIM